MVRAEKIKPWDFKNPTTSIFSSEKVVRKDGKIIGVSADITLSNIEKILGVKLTEISIVEIDGITVFCITKEMKK